MASKRRLLWLGLAGATVICAGVGLLATGHQREWTCDCPEALAELEAAREDELKLYEEDAIGHYERCLELDPGMVAAKLRLAEHLVANQPERAAQLIDEACAVDLASLTLRERFMVQRARALRHNRFDEARELVDAFLDELPNDPYALSYKAEDAWGRADLVTAERLYRRLVEVSPNWVVAHNNLGYLAMSQGRFAEAEKHFTSYRFIAPDHANPHDSLGELLVVVGRYDEAVQSFEQAIEVRPDFWLSYQHEILPLALDGRRDEARAVADRAGAGGCPGPDLVAISCTADYLQLLLTGSWQEIVQRDSYECLTSGAAGLVSVVTHRAACETRDWQRALSLENAVERAVAGSEGLTDDIVGERLGPALLHMRGVRLALAGDLTAATAALDRADEAYRYAASVPGVLKLWNRLMLAQLLHATGHKERRNQLLAEVRAVNPQLAATYKQVRLGIRR